MEWLWNRKKKDLASPINDSRVYLRDEFAHERLLTIDLLPYVTRPAMLWFAEHVNLLCGALSEFCQSSTCPTMTVPGSVLQWVDDKNKKRSCSASDYINFVMSFTHSCLRDETIFPTKYGQHFASDIEATMRKMARLLLHVLAHIYHAHCQQVVWLGLRAHLNTVTYHMMTFIKSFRLVEDRDFQLLADLYARLHHFAASREACHLVDKVNGTTVPSPWLDNVHK
jgi:hypothetical protein